MTQRDAWLLGGTALGFGFIIWKWGNPITAAQLAEQWAVNLVGRGNKLSDSTLDNGVVSEIPTVLIDMATAVLGFNADLETYSLARMGRSEGVDGMEYRMHVALNDLAQLPYGSVTELMTHSKVTRADGHYSEQDLGKRYSTARDPYEMDYALAQKVQADHTAGVDPTGGAVKFVDRSGIADYSALLASWGKEGLVPSDPLPNATSNFVVFTRQG